VIHHKYVPSHVVTQRIRVIYNPYPCIKNLFYFALQNGRQTRPLSEVYATLFRFVADMKQVAANDLAMGTFNGAQYDFFLEQLERGVEVGLSRGLHQARRFRKIPPPDETKFLPFPTPRPQRRRTFCFLSQEYPPGESGGISRFTYDLATGIAARGHKVHVVTRSSSVKCVDFEDGVWVHRLPDEQRTPQDLYFEPLKGNVHLIAQAYHETCRIHERNPIDVVSGPLWCCEGLLCTLDGRFPTVLSLMTSLKTIAGIHATWPNPTQVQQVIALETETTKRSQYIHAISNAILAKVRTEHGIQTPHTYVVPLGIQDHRAAYPRTRRPDDGRIVVLFVGRLERRKGVDLFLEAATSLIGLFPQVDFVLVGKDTIFTDIGATYREAFTHQYRDRPDILDRVTFAGQVSEEELYRHYANADIFCLPSRFESFGLVLVEAMVFGKPVVAMKIGGMQEIVQDGVNGFLAKPEDAAALAAALRRLIENEDLRQECGLQSRLRYEQHFSADIMVTNTIACYENVAQHHEKCKSAHRSREQLTRELAEVVAQATGLVSETAHRYAMALLDPVPLPTAEAPTPTFLFRLRHRLGATPAIGAVLRLGKRLAFPVFRPVGFVGQRLWHALRRHPLLRKCLRYAKRWIYLPVSVHHTRAEVHELQAQVERLVLAHQELAEQRQRHIVAHRPHPPIAA
jgi:hypothetical protein